MRLFGRSHAECIGCILEGVPKGTPIDSGYIESQMALRKPSDGIGTPRKEKDEVVIGYGAPGGVSDGGPILMVIRNGNRNSSAYTEFARTPRPGHADLPALFRFRDYDVAGGAQFSGRMTAPLVAAGAVAKTFLRSEGIEVAACSCAIGSVSDRHDRTFAEMRGSASFPTRAVDAELDAAMREEILSAGRDGDSVGGIVSCMVTGIPIGTGGMWFDALDVSVARMMMSIPAAKGVEFGKGFALSAMRGSQSNDPYAVRNGGIIAEKNDMGGVVGGMSDGMPLGFRVAFKPTPSIAREQRTVDLEAMADATVSVRGRHDPCIVPRAVAVVEAMAAIAVMDQVLSFPPDVKA